MWQFVNLLASGTGMVLFFLAQLVALLMIPFGLPGTFLQVIAALLLALLSGGARMGWLWVAVFLALALLGELIEFLSGQWGARKFGGSKWAAWGAIVGGLVGLPLGGLIPIPVLGPLFVSFIGTFAGAVVGEMHAQKSVSPRIGVGFGAVLGRAMGVAAKLSLAFAIAVLSAVVVIHNSA